MDWRLGFLFIGVVAVVNGLPNFRNLYEPNTNLDRELVLKLLQERRFRPTAEPDTDDDDTGGPGYEMRRKIIMKLFHHICQFYVDDDKRQVDDDNDNDDVFDKIRNICQELKDDSGEEPTVLPPSRGQGPQPKSRPGLGPRTTGRPGPLPDRPRPTPTGLPTIRDKALDKIIRRLRSLCDMQNNLSENNSDEKILEVICNVLDEDDVDEEISTEPPSKRQFATEPLPTVESFSTKNPFPTGGPTGGPIPTGEPGKHIKRLIDMLQRLCKSTPVKKEEGVDTLAESREENILEALCNALDKIDDVDGDDDDDISAKRENESFDISLQQRKGKEQPQPTGQPAISDLDNILNVLKMACEVIQGGKAKSSDESEPDERQSNHRQLLDAICKAIADAEDDD